MKYWKICIFLILLSSNEISFAQTKITINTGKRESPISMNLFGLFTEHIDDNVYQGAWSQIVVNPEFVPETSWPVRDYGSRMEAKLKKFQQEFKLPTLLADSKNGFAAYWASAGDISGRLLKDGIHDFQQLKAGEQGGYIQTGIFLPLHRTTGYEIALTGRAEETTEVVVQYLNFDETVIGETTFQLSPTWKTIEKSLGVTGGKHEKGDPYWLRLVVKPGTLTEFSRILCFPDDHIDGWEPELVALLKDMKLPLLRFPGGNFVSGYHWQDGVGAMEQRPVRQNPAWHEMEWNHVGTDEWINLCRLVGAEPMICVNAGNGTPEEAANWVRYCNDPATTPMGKLRAKNGHEEPYNVKIWEVGNELCGPWQVGFTDGEGYARRYAAFEHELLRADSSIVLIANGLIRVLERSEEIDRGDDPDWNRKLMEYNGDRVRSISVHSLVGRAVDDKAPPAEVWKDLVAFVENYPDFLQKLVVDPMEEANVEPRVAITELMDWPRPPSVGNVTSISGALWYSGIINTCIRSNGLVELVTRSALMNHGGGLRKERGIIYAEPVYWGHLMYSNQKGTIPLEVKTSSPLFNSTGRYVIKKENMPVIDAVSLMDPRDQEISVFICNREMESTQQVELVVEGMELDSDAELMMIHAADIALRNVWSQPEKVAPVFEELPVKDNRIQYSLPPLSLVRITLSPK